MAADLRDNFRLHARYNTWMNQRLMDGAEQLSDDERKRDGCAFFKSIHGTLNHMLVTDQVWLERFVKAGADHGLRFASLEAPGLIALPAGHKATTILFENWTGVRQKRALLDMAVEQWFAGMPVEYPDLNMRYSNSKGVERHHPTWKALTHFFNHQTHHRSQALTLMTQAGVDIGTTDMISLL